MIDFDDQGRLATSGFAGNAELPEPLGRFCNDASGDHR
jgi:hypothetical protein